MHDDVLVTKPDAWADLTTPVRVLLRAETLLVSPRCGTVVCRLGKPALPSIML